MNRLENHLIVCGYGRMGRLVCREFSEARVPFVVIDSNEAALAQFELTGGVPLHGDATSDDCLRRAGIARARALVTVVPADADNLFITMSARLLNERLRIVERKADASRSVSGNLAIRSRRRARRAGHLATERARVHRRDDS